MGLSAISRLPRDSLFMMNMPTPVSVYNVSKILPGPGHSRCESKQIIGRTSAMMQYQLPSLN